MPNSSVRRQSAPAAESSSTSRSLFFPNYTWPAIFLRHRVRLSRGLIQFALLDLIRQRSEGRKRGKGEPVPDWCWKFSIAEIAREWGCSDRELRADLEDAVKRGLLECRRIGNEVECRLTCADSELQDGLGLTTWEKLPSYKRGPQAVDPAEPEEEPGEETAAKAAASRPVHRKIAALRAGAEPKPAKVDRFVDEVLPVWDGPGEVKLELVWEAKRLSVFGTLTSNGVNELRKTSGSAVPISVSTGAQNLPGSGDLLADLIRVQTGLVVDGPGCRRIERALNGSIPLPFYLGELATAVESVKNPRAGLAIHLAEHQIKSKWRLSQKAGPPADDDGMPEDQKKLMRQLRGGR